jgi:hypothetical protein
MPESEVDKVEEVVLAQASAVGGWKGMLVAMVPRFLLRSAIREAQERVPSVVQKALDEHEAGMDQASASRRPPA